MSWFFTPLRERGKPPEPLSNEAMDLFFLKLRKENGLPLTKEEEEYLESILTLSSK